MIAAVLVALTCRQIEDNWSPLYPIHPGDIDAKWRYTYAKTPLRRSPLYAAITKDVEKAVADGKDLHVLADRSVSSFNQKPRMDLLARATLLNYYGYLIDNQFDWIPPGWYESAWLKMNQLLVAGKVSQSDFSPNDYYLSRIRFLSDSCSEQYLPIRQAGYRLYQFDSSDILVATRLAWVLEASSKFERETALKIVDRLKRDAPSRWQTWAVAAYVYQWTGYHTGSVSYLKTALSSVDHALAIGDVPENKKEGLNRRRETLVKLVQRGFPKGDGG